MILSVEKNENEKEKNKERMDMRKYMRMHYFVRIYENALFCKSAKYMRRIYENALFCIYCIYEKVYENAKYMRMHYFVNFLCRLLP